MAARKPKAQLRPKQVVAAGRVTKRTTGEKESCSRTAADRTVANGNSPLLRLPAELRNEIYSLSLRHAFPSFDISKKRLKEPGLLQACKQTRSEASPIFYTVNRIYGEVRNLDFSIIIQRLHRISGFGIKSHKSVQLWIVGQYRKRWDLEALLPLVKFFAETGLDLSWGGNLWWMYNGGFFTRTGHCVQAQEMGIKAFAEGWTEEQLEDEFVHEEPGPRACQRGHLRAERDFLVAAEGSRWVVPLIASFQDDTNLYRVTRLYLATNLYLVMEYMIGGDFLGLLLRETLLDEEIARWYIAEMTRCVEGVHTMKAMMFQSLLGQMMEDLHPLTEFMPVRFTSNNVQM